MDEDTEDAAWAQLECEQREYSELLANDPGYEQWAKQLNEERDNEICSES